MRPSPLAVFLPLFLVVSVLTGCDRVNRVRDCRRLSALVNPALDAIQAQAMKGTAKDYRAVAGSYGNLAQAIRRAPELPANGKALVGEYTSMLDSVAPAVSAYANALDVKDERNLDEARRTLSRLTNHEHGLVTRIDAYCQAP